MTIRFKNRFVSTLAMLTLVLAVGVIAGCPNPGDKKRLPNEQPGKDHSTTLEEGEARTVKFMVQRIPDTSMSNQLPWVQEFINHTNIQFDWIAGPEDIDQYKEKFNLTVASGEIPDLVEGPGDMLIKAGEAGIFVPIDLSKMPHLQKLVDSNPAYARAMNTDHGQIYYLPNFMAVKPYNAIMIREDWLTKLHLQYPETPEEMYQVLKAFKQRDPNQNGIADEIPFTTRNKANGLAPFIEPFGISTEEDFIVENGEVGYTFTKPQFKEALLYLNKLFTEGLIDQEYATNDSRIWDHRLLTEVSGVTWDVFARQDYFNKSLAKVNDTAYLSIMMPLKGENGERYTKSQQLPVNATGVAISSQSDDINGLLKWADWFYSPEGQLIFNFGIEGYTFTMENGEPKYTDVIMNDPSLTPGGVMKALGRIHWFSKLDIRYENASQSADVITKRDELSKYIKERFPKEYLTYTSAERSIINSKFIEITAFKDEMMNKFIYGSEPIDKFDEYAATMNTMGLADVVKVQQAAYDRFMKR